MKEDMLALNQFSGFARLFPLPNVVLFPHAVQPLHIFEPRYRQMTADALADDRLIALVLLRPGWEANYEQRPALHEICCLGRITGEQRLSDGRFNLLLRGLSRARIVQEAATDKLYRIAKVQLLPDANEPGSKAQATRMRLAARVLPFLSKQGHAVEQLRKLVESDLSLGVLADLFAFSLPLDVELKQKLLEIPEVNLRVRRLLGYMKKYAPASAAGAAPRKFPPEFSTN